MAKKTKNKKAKPFVGGFIQDWGTYTNETFVTIGMTFEQITKRLKSFGKGVTVDWLREEDKIRERMNSNPGAMVWYCDGRTVLWFPSWKNDWQHWDTLVHEISHLVHSVLGDSKGMREEDEACAYQSEFLFRQIRRAIWERTDLKHPSYRKNSHG